MRLYLYRLLVFSLFLGLPLLSFSQRSSFGNSQADQSGGNWWYGGNFVLNFAANNNNSLFQIGVAPMAGYKFTPSISFGPRVSLTYSHYRTISFNTGETLRFNPVTWSLGMFSRAKIINPFFAHVEYSYESELGPIGFNDELIRQERGNIYIGGGINQGDGVLGYEILILYNTTLVTNTIESPWDIRVGFTYNF